MSTVPYPAADPENRGPVFFLSHARTPVSDPLSGRDPDFWVRRFYEDLCKAAAPRMPDAAGAQIGFSDITLPLGSPWLEQINWSLATCRLFIALYSPRYFNTEHCGREWQAIVDRIAADKSAGRPTVRIIPLVWAPVNLQNLPSAARDLQLQFGRLSAAYLDFGISGLIRLSRWKHDYQELLHWLAEQIDEAAREPLPTPRPVRDYSSLPNAFEDASPSPSVPRLRITVFAPTANTVPEGRDPRYYGPRAVDWRPFDSGRSRALALACADAATSFGFQPTVEDWQSSDLGEEREEVDSPGLLLVDPWLIEPGGEADAWLGRFDRGGHTATGIVIATDAEDPQSTEAAAVLDARLRRALPSRLANRRSYDRSATRVGSLEQLEKALPTVTSVASRQFLRQAKAYPPKGDVPIRARLVAPDANHAADPARSRKDAPDE